MTKYTERLFDTSLTYTGRESKAVYVYDKYKTILTDSVLDVGGDAMYLKSHILKGGGTYVGVGYGPNIDLSLNLELGKLPYEDNSFDTVLCLDVLEHLEVAHAVFYEICRVSKRYVVISLPNPWGLFFQMLMDEKTFPTPWIKWYGLPIDPPEDRHRWFFSEAEAKLFLQSHGKRAGYKILQMDSEDINPKLGGAGFTGVLRRMMIRLFLRLDIKNFALDHGTLWCVLEKQQNISEE